MAKNKKSSDTIVISKDKLLKVVGITIGILLFLVVCFAISSSNSENYQESTTTEQDSSGDDSLEIAIKEAGEVSDDERVSPTEITVDEYLDIYNGTEKQIILLSRPTCQYCQIATPILENLIYNYDIKINYINTDELDDDSNAKLVTSDDYFSEGYGTPTVLVVGNGEIKDTIDGLVTRDDYISFFKQYGFMED